MMKRIFSLVLIISLLSAMIPASMLSASTVSRNLPARGGETRTVVHNVLSNPLRGGLIGELHIEVYVSSHTAQEIIRGMDVMSSVSDTQTLFNYLTLQNPFTIPGAYKMIFHLWMRNNIDFRGAVARYDLGDGIIITMNGALASDDRVAGVRSQLVRFAQPRQYDTMATIDMFANPNGARLGTLTRDTTVNVIGSRGDSFSRSRTWYLLDTGVWVDSRHLEERVAKPDVFINVWASPPEGGIVEVEGFVGATGNRFIYGSTAWMTATADPDWMFDGWFDGMTGRRIINSFSHMTPATEDMMIEARFSRRTQTPPPQNQQPPNQQPPNQDQRPDDLPSWMQDPPQLDIGAFERRILELTNAERANYGLPPLAWNPNLANVARAHSQDMADMGRLSHVGSDGSQPLDRIMRAGFSSNCATSENINAPENRGTSISVENVAQTMPERVVASWMNSPPHRANILNPNKRHIGVGAVVAIREYEYQEIAGFQVRHLTRIQVYVTQNFVQEFVD